MWPYLVALILLTVAIWATMEWAFYRELHYLRNCLRIQSLKIVTNWPGREEWRLASEELANRELAVAAERVPLAAVWREPDIMPDAIMMETEPEELLKVVNIMAALEDDDALDGDRSQGALVAKAPPHPRRKSARIRRAAG